MGQDYFRCTIIGDKAYLSADIQYNLFDSANIQLEVPSRYNLKDWKPFHKPFAKARKRLETNFSQFTDQFNIMRNYAKDYRGKYRNYLPTQKMQYIDYQIVIN